MTKSMHEIRKAKNKAFTDELKEFLDKHDVILSPATEDATDRYPAEFRSRDDGRSIYVEIDDDLKIQLHGDHLQNG